LLGADFAAGDVLTLEASGEEAEPSANTGPSDAAPTHDNITTVANANEASFLITARLFLKVS